MTNNLNDVRPEVIRHIVNSFNTKDFVSDILFTGGLQNSRYQNAKGMFAWNKPYTELEKMEQLFNNIIVFPASVNSWDFPLVYDEETQIVFLLMSENNLNQRRKQKITEEQPPHYSKVLSEINQILSNQLTFLKVEPKNPIEILSQYTDDNRIKQLSQNIKLAIVTCQTIHGDVFSVTVALYDKALMLIDDAIDWSSYIDTSYDSDSIIDAKTEKQIEETNANIILMREKQENLLSFKQEFENESIGDE